MSKKPSTRRLLPVGRTDALNRDQQARVQALWLAKRIVPAGDLKAHNIETMADYILKGLK